MFEKFINRYIIKGNIVATTAIHIGASENEFQSKGNKNLFFRNAEGLPMIPGSSIKGLMRSFFEQMIRSDIGKDLFPESFVCVDIEPCADDKNKEFKALLENHEKDAEKNLADYLYGANGKLCTVCRIFGSNYNAAKLLIRDAKVIEETFQNAFEIRNGVSIDRDLGESKENHFYEVEVVPERTAFSFYAVLENAEVKEWACIKILLSAMERGMLTIGGMKSRGFGGIELKDITYQEIKGDNIIGYLKGDKIEEISLSVND